MKDKELGSLDIWSLLMWRMGARLVTNKVTSGTFSLYHLVEKMADKVPS